MHRPWLERTLGAARERLLALRTPAGHWEGDLSSSALSTAVASWALAVVDRERKSAEYAALVRGGLDWLAANQNEDGGWGDTVLSKSNISTTLLAWSAMAASDGRPEHARAVERAEAWLRRHVGSLEAASLARAVDARYGQDRTFSAPILTTCALAGRLGPAAEAWGHVMPLPFELAAFPHRWWRWLRLPVVSYALPALIAIGQARFHFRPPRNPASCLVRRLARGRTLEILTSIQPKSGGFLEAAPLTSFVVMSLAAAGHADHAVASRGAAFLASTVRPDGSWPIDTNLATWVTTLSVSALAAGADLPGVLPADARRNVLDWLLGQQYREEHPYTHAPPGAWAWTDLAGGVPDADDTAGALVALRHLDAGDPRAREAAARGAAWLLDLQNRDGGIPTFCRGWGLLLFDRSSPDLTAHAIAAWDAWLPDLPPHVQARAAKAIARALAYLARTQRAGGEWAPLWFGNQFAPGEENPTYGTSRVLAALAPMAAMRGSVMDERGGSQVVRGGSPDPPRDSAACEHTPRSPRDNTHTCGGSGRRLAVAREPPRTMVERGIRWLLASQNWDGGWGGAPATPSSIEETALAVDALARCFPYAPDLAAIRRAVDRGAGWLMAHTDEGTRFDPSPIGFYFAKLWYYERLYPIIFTVAALERARSADYTA
jgi:squalene-hopene/tetraprenyl-beta-curcumene cyclase